MIQRASSASRQVEFRYISKVTGDARWQEAADKALDVVLKAAEASDRRGLVPPGRSEAFKSPAF